MPPGLLSRHRFCSAVPQSDGTTMLTDREPYAYRDIEDTRRHTVIQGDTLHTLAAKFFDSDGVRNPDQLFWVIADFQPEPITDPTVRLEPGRVMFIPSLRTLFEEILNEKRRIEHQ